MLLTTVLLTIFAIPGADLPNLCDDVFVNEEGIPYTDSKGQTLSRFCEWTGPEAPVWDGSACCTIDVDTAYCSTTNALGECDAGDEMYCEYGTEVLGGGVVCYQPLPSACDAGICVEEPVIPPPGLEAVVMCCNGGACQYVTIDTIDNCQGDLLACSYGSTTTEGTVECYE